MYYCGDGEKMWRLEAELGQSEKVAFLTEDIPLEGLDELLFRLCVKAVATAAPYFALEQADSPVGHGHETESPCSS